MQVQFYDIRGRERLLWQGSEEEFVHGVPSRNANGTLLFARRMRGYDHAALHLLGSHRYLRAIVEAAYRLAFWALLELIRGEVQACLHERMIEHCVFFASGHKGEASQIGEHGPSAILSIKPQQGALRRKLVRASIA